MNPLTTAAGVLIVVLGLAAYLLYGETQDLREALATERSNVVVLQRAVQDRDAAIKDLELQRVRDEAALQRMNDQMIDANRDLSEATARYNRVRSTLDAETLKRPEVVGRAARIAIDRSMRAVESATGAGAGDNGNPAADRPAAVPGVQAGSAATGGGDAGGNARLE